MSTWVYLWRIRKSFILAVTVLVFPDTFATPPDYKTFRRAQQIDYSPDPSEVLRIWMINVAQGDGLLIQLPSKYNYDPDPADGDTTKSERIDVIVDGGANPTSEAGRLSDFVSDIYGATSPIIEYTVITHHDQDHVIGITKLLGASEITFDTIFHNGLASYRGGKHGLPVNTQAGIVAIGNDGKIQRALGRVNSSGRFEPGFLIHNLAELKTGLANDEFHGIYDDLARAATAKAYRDELKAFQRAGYSAPFISERLVERGVNLPDIKFNVLWPETEARSYGGNDWGETINGNSVTFQLAYKDFSMLFTGDQNDKSEPELLKFLRAEGKLNLLDCDVMKVPHHASSHGVREFFQREGFEPVLAVASMGDVGFKSKKMSSLAWQHPSMDVIEWLGGPHRVYHTFVVEKAFNWNDVTSEAIRSSLIEKTHILIETDGKWFRLVEIPVGNSVHFPPTIAQTRRGDGTRWIKASTN
jgi:hypothetical protein